MSRLIVFIHGIGSDSKVWDDFVKILNADNETRNIQLYNGLSVADNNDEIYYFLYEYDSTILMSTPAIARLKERATGKVSDGNLTILDHAKTLSSKIRQWEDTFDSIDIVAHSMGGIITMFMIFSLLEKNCLNKINKCLLYAVPLKGSDDPQELINILGRSVVAPISQELLPDSVTIESLIQQLNYHKESLKKYFKIQYIAANADSRIVQINDSFIQIFGEVEQIAGDHASVVRPQKISDDSFFWFKKHIISNSKKIEISIPYGTNNIAKSDDLHTQPESAPAELGSLYPSDNNNPSTIGPNLFRGLLSMIIIVAVIFVAINMFLNISKLPTSERGASVISDLWYFVPILILLVPFLIIDRFSVGVTTLYETFGGISMFALFLSCCFFALWIIISDSIYKKGCGVSALVIFGAAIGAAIERLYRRI